jgi:serine/threonine-protein kinase RsbW
VPSARAFVRHALRTVNAPNDAVESLVLATAEACNNAILHARGTAFIVSVALDAGRATVAVTDDGDGFVPPEHPAMPAPHATGRRGLALMEALVDEVDLTSGDRGTTVVLVQSLMPAPVAAGRRVAAER